MLRPPVHTSRHVLGIVVLSACLPTAAQDLAAPGALGADMLPKGRAAARLETRGIQADEEFNRDGDRRALGANYDGLNLNATLFPALSPLGPGATLGTTDLSSRLNGQQTRLTFGYGLAEDVTVGFQVGYGEAKNRVDVSVSGSNLGATGLPAPNPSFLPLALLPPGTPPTGAEDVQALLTGVYGYKRVQSSTWHSALDPLIGLRWRFDKGEHHATVFAPSLRFGIAKETDPDDLMQMTLADSTNDILLGVLHTRKLSERWDLLLSAQYTIQLADHVTARARSENELLVPASRRERLRRDRTDPIEFTVDAGYSEGPWRFSGRLEYARGGRDDYSSPSGQDVSGLEANTDFHFLLGYLGVSWNGIPGYLRGEHRLPLLVSLMASTTLTAKNTSAPDTLYLTATLPF